MTYYEQLKDPRWDKCCLDLIQSRGWKCCHCQKETRKLQVHHGAYLKGVELWDYPPEMLHILCAECHERTTGHIDTFMRWFGRLSPQDVYSISILMPQFQNEFPSEKGSRMFTVICMILNSIEGCDLELTDFADEIIARLNQFIRTDYRLAGYRHGVEQAEFSKKCEKEGPL